MPNENNTPNDVEVTQAVWGYQDLKQDIAEIKKAIIGDEKYKQKGLLERVADLEDHRDKMDGLVTSGKWFVIGLVLAAGYGVTEFVGRIIEFVTHKK